ncbi:MAG: hypothetical protein R3D33_01415 [Hyphomicrobiaceae bacterium]
MSLSEWEAAGRPGALQAAREKAQAILSTHYPRTIDESTDRLLRERYPIRLARAAMQPGNGRW